MADTLDSGDWCWLDFGHSGPEFTIDVTNTGDRALCIGGWLLYQMDPMTAKTTPVAPPRPAPAQAAPVPISLYDGGYELLAESRSWPPNARPPTVSVPSMGLTVTRLGSPPTDECKLVDPKTDTSWGPAPSAFPPNEPYLVLPAGMELELDLDFNEDIDRKIGTRKNAVLRFGVMYGRAGPDNGFDVKIELGMGVKGPDRCLEASIMIVLSLYNKNQITFKRYFQPSQTGNSARRVYHVHLGGHKTGRWRLVLVRIGCTCILHTTVAYTQCQYGPRVHEHRPLGLAHEIKSIFCSIKECIGDIVPRGFISVFFFYVHFLNIRLFTDVISSSVNSRS